MHPIQAMQPTRVLVVDDDTDIRELLAEFLVLHGYDVATSANGAEALAYLESHARPDLVLLDLEMPMMDGYGFRERQMQVPEWSDIPTIIVSAARAVDTNRTHGALVLAKPVRIEKLEKAIERELTGDEVAPGREPAADRAR